MIIYTAIAIVLIIWGILFFGLLGITIHEFIQKDHENEILDIFSENDNQKI